MAHRYAQIAFTDNVRRAQTAQGSRHAYARLDEGQPRHDRLGDFEAGFIAARDSFYMATVNSDGWPYVQHRGGPAGFVRVLDDSTLGFADFTGNRQYVSLGNALGDALGDDRVSLFFMDYPNRARLKLFGRISLVPDNDPATLERLENTSYRARVERGFLIHVEAFDWNCPQHITPRFTEDEWTARMQPHADTNSPEH